MALKNVFAELARRNVLRAGALYLGAVWALAQGIAQLGPAIGLSDEVTRWFLIAAVIGFPFFLAFAWFYEFTPDGLMRESEIAPEQSVKAHTGRKLDFAIIGVLAVAVVLLLTDRLMLRHAVNETAAAVVPEASIAVLPFVNRSADKGQDYFADGISEDMLNLLAKVPKLKVISRSSSFSFKGKDVPLKEIAATLGVAYILEGSVQRADNTLRISAQLVDARHDQNVWAQRWDRPLEDVFKIQDEVAAAVVGQLKLKLLGKAQAIDPEAYAGYLQARQLIQQGSRAGYAQAIPLLQQVLAKVPGYAPAWDMLAMTYMNQAASGSRPVDEGARLAREAINQALAAEPDYAPIYARLGWLELAFGNELAASTLHFERALALDPGDPGILRNAASLASSLGRLNQAIALNKASLALDPVSATLYYNLANDYYSARHPDEAITNYRTALRLSPGYSSAQAHLALALLQRGDASAALDAVQKEPEEAWRMIALPIVYHALKRTVDADAALAELISKYAKEAPYNIAYVWADRGDADQAFAWLDKAQEYQDPGLSGIAGIPLFDSLKKDPRWLPLLRKLGYAPEQLAKIQFKITLPDSAATDAAEIAQ